MRNVRGSVEHGKQRGYVRLQEGPGRVCRLRVQAESGTAACGAGRGLGGNVDESVQQLRLAERRDQCAQLLVGRQ